MTECLSVVSIIGVYSFDTNSGCAHWAFEAEFRIRSNVAVSDGVIVFGDTGANAYALNAENWQAYVAPQSRLHADRPCEPVR